MKTLVCDIAAGDRFCLDNRDQTSSPVQCIEKALSENYELIVIYFPARPIKQRDALIELCALLKRNDHTCRIPVLALLPVKHRALLEKLSEVKVEYAKIINHESVANTYQHIDARDAVSTVLSGWCPYIAYQPIDRHRELVVCGAYYSRLVLSGNRLARTCQHPDFKSCPYFQSPKISNAQKNKAGIKPEVFYDVLQSIS